MVTRPGHFFSNHVKHIGMILAVLGHGGIGHTVKLLLYFKAE
jgi:hypothetical protein